MKNEGIWGGEISKPIHQRNFVSSLVDVRDEFSGNVKDFREEMREGENEKKTERERNCKAARTEKPRLICCHGPR